MIKCVQVQEYDTTGIAPCVHVCGWLLKQLNKLKSYREKLLYLTLINPENTGKDQLKNYNMCYLADALQIYTQKN